MSDASYVKLMTDGILLAETQGDPLLSAYDTLIIDEAHERSLNIDFLLGYLRQLLAKRPDLKVIVTSATLDADRFAQHFAVDGKPAPVIEVSGRLYPIEMRWRPVDADGSRSAKDRDIADAIVDAVDEAFSLGPGDVLVFLSGEREIREAAEALRKHHFSRGAVEILPLFARQSAQEQQRVFAPHQGRRVVLATNVAETSLTVPGIRYVVDTGLARVKRYSHRNKVEQLQVEPVAQSAAKQRAGRCGRVASGVCFRLYAEDDYAKRPVHTDPEILRSSLAGVILRMGSLKLGEVEDFPFLDRPLPRMVADGYQLLNELGAVDEDRTLTPLGRELAKLPADPKIGRMILAAREQGALREVLIIAAALSVQDPRDRPQEAAGSADQAHAKFRGPEAEQRSEFLWFLRAWAAFDEQWTHQTQKKQRDWCRQHFLNYMRMREWRDVHAQLHTLAAEHGWRENDKPASYEAIHKALLAGLLGNIGVKSDEDAHYLGARGIKWFPHPGSALAKKAGKWVMAAELVETTRLFARCLAKIEPEWVEQVGAHLVKKHVFEPHWSKGSGHVAAFERATLYGLVLYARRPVAYSRIDPAQCREIFIREALVRGDLPEDVARRAPFFQHNRQLIADIERLEHKTRRPDVLVDEDLIHAFYDARLPAEIADVRAFEAWRRDAESKQPKLLFLEREQLMRHEAAGVTTDRFPANFELHGQKLKLTYHHDPGAADDGVTLTVPLALLNQVPACALRMAGTRHAGRKGESACAHRAAEDPPSPAADQGIRAGFLRARRRRHGRSRAAAVARACARHRGTCLAQAAAGIDPQREPAGAFVDELPCHRRARPSARPVAQSGRTACALRARRAAALRAGDGRRSDRDYGRRARIHAGFRPGGQGIRRCGLAGRCGRGNADWTHHMVVRRAAGNHGSDGRRARGDRLSGAGR